MKKLFLFLILIIFLLPNSKAQKYIFQFSPWGSREWGYMDLEGNVIIEPQSRKCYDFSEEGLALVYYSRQNRYDIINLKNEVVDIEPDKFMVKEGFGYGAQGFSSGLLGFQIHKKWGAIDRHGKIVIPNKYDFLSKFIDGYATARLDDKYYIIDSIGNEIEIKENNITKIKMFSEGLTMIQNDQGLIGYVNHNGEIVIQLQFKSAGYFRSKVAWARSANGLSGYIDKNGEWVIEPKFMAVRDFDPESQLAKARVDHGWGYINKRGEITYMRDVKKIYDYSEGLAMVVNLDGLFGFVDRNQNWIMEPQFDAAREFKNGYACVRKDGKWGIVDKSGNWIIEPVYSGVKDVVKLN